jgi:hypothetical protein
MNPSEERMIMKKLVLTIALLAILPASSTFANSDMAKIVTQNKKPAECLSSIAVNKIDGEERIVPAQGFEIEPGTHSINGRAALDTTFCSVGRGGNLGWHAADLEVDFEAGKTYYIGYDHKSKNRDEWKLVVWKVE